MLDTLDSEQPTMCASARFCVSLISQYLSLFPRRAFIKPDSEPYFSALRLLLFSGTTSLPTQEALNTTHRWHHTTRFSKRPFVQHASYPSRPLAMSQTLLRFWQKIPLMDYANLPLGLVGMSVGQGPQIVPVALLWISAGSITLSLTKTGRHCASDLARRGVRFTRSSIL